MCKFGADVKIPLLQDIRLFLARFRFSELPLLETVESHSLHGHHAMQYKGDEDVASGTLQVEHPHHLSR